MNVNKCSYCNKRKGRFEEWNNEIAFESGYLLDKLIFCCKKCKCEFIKKYTVENTAEAKSELQRRIDVVEISLKQIEALNGSFILKEAIKQFTNRD